MGKLVIPDTVTRFEVKDGEAASITLTLDGVKTYPVIEFMLAADTEEMLQADVDALLTTMGMVADPVFFSDHGDIRHAETVCGQIISVSGIDLRDGKTLLGMSDAITIFSYHLDGSNE